MTGTTARLILAPLGLTLALAQGGCAGAAPLAAIADLPAYPGAVEL